MTSPRSSMCSLRQISSITCALLISFIAQGETEDRIQQRFAAKPGGRLVIEADRGSIEVQTADTAQVEIEVLRIAKAISKNQESELIQRHKVDIRDTADEVRITAKSEEESLWRRNMGLQVRFVARVPASYNAQLKTAGGSIKVADLQGELSAATSGGSIQLGYIKGKVSAKTSGGNIRLGGSDRQVDVTTSGGSIQMGQIQGDLNARTSGGSIQVEHAGGTTTLGTSGGSIKASLNGGSLEANTSGGSIHAVISRQPNGPCTLKTSGGGIELRLDTQLELDVDASTSGGSVSTDVPVTVQGEISRTQLRGKLNGGGPKLTARTSGGSIRIRANKPGE